MNQPKAILIIIFCIFLLNACGKNPPFSHTTMNQCHNQIEWDSLSTATTLLGKWEWKFIECFAETEQMPSNDEYKGLTVEFFSDNTLELVEPDGQITIAEWKIELEDGDFFGLDVTPGVLQLYGRILFCEETVKFNDHYRDGCDNFFEKI